MRTLQGCEKQKKQIRILADLTMKTQSQIKKILEAAGFDLSKLKNVGMGRPSRAWYSEHAQKLYDEGTDIDAMARIIGVERWKLADWHRRNGYKPIYRRCSVCVHGKEDGSGHIACVWNGKVKRMDICGRFEEV